MSASFEERMQAFLITSFAYLSGQPYCPAEFEKQCSAIMGHPKSTKEEAGVFAWEKAV